MSAAGITVPGGAVFATCGNGLVDGLRVDMHGNQWLSSAEGVTCQASDGKRLGRIRIWNPEAVANLCFGSPKSNRLFICGTTSLYAAYLTTRAAPRGS